MVNANVLIDNDKVKVTEWSFEVGDSTGHHIHEYNYIVVPMFDGELRIIDKDNNETISNVTSTNETYRDCTTDGTHLYYTSASFTGVGPVYKIAGN